MKVLFTHSYFLHFDAKQLELSKPYPPLATLLAASFMRENRFDVSFFDVTFEKSASAILPVLTEQKPAVFVIYDDGFNYLTKMCLTNMRDAAYEMARLAHNLGIKVIISSSDSTDHYAAYLENGADAVLLGEAEDTLLETLQHLQAQKPIDAIPGLASVKNGEIVSTGKRPVRTQLDELPVSAWDLLDIKPYQNAWKRHGYFSINMATTRGCPYKCNWCAKPIYGNRYNSRSPQKVVDELMYMKTLFHFDHIWFSDDIFGLKPNWVKEFNTVLKSTSLKFTYKIQSRADLLLKDETINDLAESGAEEIWIGAESGSQKILDAMDKGTTVEQIYAATQLMKKHGLKPCFFLQFGYLDEQKVDIDATLNMVFELMPHDIGVSVSYPLPGTKFYEKVKSQLTEKTNWTDSDELLLMYKSTFSPEYYKTIHRYLHKAFRGKQSVLELKKVLSFKSCKFKKSISFIYFKPASWIEKLKLAKLEN
jgi:anaerobic magnesium-protoporphyrin IX monomethyl ester cyclase